MFVVDGMGAGGGGEAPLDAREAVVLWGVRRLAPAMDVQGAMARCPAVEVALIRQFGGGGHEIGVVLRCLVQALGVGALRPLRLGCPALGGMTGDERLLLAALRAPCGAMRPLGALIEPARVETVVRLVTLLARLMRGA